MRNFKLTMLANKNIFPAVYLRILCDRFYEQQLQGVLWSAVMCLFRIL
mgnify:CR=1 FL=1